MSKPITIYVGTIAWRALEAMHVQCVLRLLRDPGVVYDVKVGDALVERARAIVATRFLLETTAEVLVTIDSDILFEAEAVREIAEQAVTHDIVAGLYVTRSNQRCIPTSHFLADQPVTIGDDPTPVPIKWAASGFVATHRRVFEALAADLPLCHRDEDWRFYPFYTPFVYEDEEAGTIYLSEDWAFAERAREHGFGVYCNPAVRLSHLGTYPYNASDLLRTELPTEPMMVTRRRGAGARYHVEQPDEGPEIVLPLHLDRAARRRQEREHQKELVRR